MKETMNQEEKIEYYLGKDYYNNSYFNAEKLLSAYEIHDSRSNYSEFKSANILRCINYGLPTEEPQFIYFNNLGFRSNLEFTLENLSKYEKLVLCLGCSDVLSPNLLYDEMWTTKLQDELGETFCVLNLGIFTAATDTVSRVLFNFTSLLPNISDVCIIWPVPARSEFVSKSKTCIVVPQLPKTHPFEEYYNVVDWKTFSYNFHKNRIFCEQLCKSKGLNFYDLYINRDDEKVPFDSSSKARAFGIKTNIAFSNYFLKKILKQPSLFEKSKNNEI